MTITALFRDFLILNRAKKNYEEAMLSTFHPISLTNPIDWSNDRLWEIIKSRMALDNPPAYKYYRENPSIFCYEWLIGVNALHSTFSWEKSKNGTEYWSRLSDKWAHYLKHNLSTIDNDNYCII